MTGKDYDTCIAKLKEATDYLYEAKLNKVTSWSSTTTDTKYPSEKLVKDTLDTKANSSSLSTVATSGSYTDLSNKPSIPSSSSDLSDGSDIIKKSNTTGLIKNDGTIDTTSYISSLPSASTSTQGIVQLVDNLTTSDDTKALTAKQGKAIADMIGTAISYIQQ